MSSLRLLNSGEWNKDPVLIAARRLVFSALGTEFESVLLGDVATFLNGTSYDKAHAHAAGVLPVIRISNISDPSSQYVRTDEVLPDRFLVAVGDLLVSWSASFKSIIWPGPAGLLNQHIFKVTEKAGFDRHFIRHAIEASFEKMQEGVVGIGMMHLRRDAFLSHPIPRIPLALQRQVARYLDAVEKRGPRPEDASHECLAKALRAVDRIEAIAGKIEEARRLRREAEEEAASVVAGFTTRIFDKLFRGRVAPIRSLGAEGSNPIQIGPFGAQLHSSEFTSSGVPVLNVGNVWPQGIRTDRVDYVSRDKATQLRRYAVQTGDLLFARSGATLGKVCLVPDECNGWLMTGHLFRVRFDRSRINNRFAFIGLRDARQVQDRLFGQVRGATRPGYNTTLLGNIEIPVPSMDVQHQVVGEVDAIQYKLNRLTDEHGQTSRAIAALLPSTLDSAFRGDM